MILTLSQHQPYLCSFRLNSALILGIYNAWALSQEVPKVGVSVHKQDLEVGWNQFVKTLAEEMISWNHDEAVCAVCTLAETEECLGCGTKESSRWRAGMCGSCYHKERRKKQKEEGI